MPKQKVEKWKIEAELWADKETHKYHILPSTIFSEKVLNSSMQDFERRATTIIIRSLKIRRMK